MSAQDQQAAETLARMRELLEHAHAHGTPVHVSGTSAAVFVDCVVERVDAERVWLTPANHPGAYTPRLTDLVLVAVPGGECVTRARGRGQLSARVLGTALEGVRKLSTARLSETQRDQLEDAVALLAAIGTGAEESRGGETPEKPPPRPRPRRQPPSTTPMLPL